MMAVERIPVRRVMTAEQATELVGGKVEPHEPTFREAALFYDQDTGEAVLGHLPAPEFEKLRATILGIDWGKASEVYRNGTGNRNKSQTFGFRGRRPMMMREGCELAAFSRDHPEATAFLSYYAELLANELREAFPEIEVMGREIIQQVHPEWRLSQSSLWTSGVINKESALPYHRDGNNFDAWSVMPVLRYGVRGGHLHIPEYDMVVPCRDGYVVMFFGKRLVHGVTPMKGIKPDGYRVSVVYYALKGMKDCHTHAVEQAEARRRRTEREEGIAAKVEAGEPIEQLINRQTRDVTGTARLSKSFEDSNTA